MGDDSKKNDLTRLEDLASFDHSDSEIDFTSVDSEDGFQEPPIDEEISEMPYQGFSEDKTDPNLQLPEEFTSTSFDYEQKVDSNLSDQDEFPSEEFDEKTVTDFTSLDSDETESDQYESEFENFDFESSEDQASFQEEQDQPIDSTSAANNYLEELADTQDNSDQIEESSFPISEESFQEETLFSMHEETINSPPAVPTVIETKNKSETTKLSTNVDFITTQKENKGQEDFSDLKSFQSKIYISENFNIEGNPPYSLLISEIKYQEDIDALIEMLFKYQIINDANKEQAIRLMNKGTYLISRINEYAAIILAHQLKKFSFHYSFGLSEHIHPLKTLDDPDVGIMTKRSLFQNTQSEYDSDKLALRPDNIIISSNSQVTGYSKQRHIDHIQASIEVDKGEDILMSDQNVKKLEHKIRLKASEMGGNSVLNLQYQVIHLSKGLYEILGTGNLTWIEKF